MSFWMILSTFGLFDDIQDIPCNALSAWLLLEFMPQIKICIIFPRGILS